MTYSRVGWRIALLVVCAASPASAQVRIRLPAWQEPVMLDSMRQEHQIDAKPEAVYAAVAPAFEKLGIPMGKSDSAAGIIGSERFDKSTQLAGARMSLSFDCGQTSNMENADHSRMTIVVAVWVKPGERGGTNFAVAAAGSGLDVTGINRNPRGCSSTGWLETKILDMVTKLAK